MSMEKIIIIKIVITELDFVAFQVVCELRAFLSWPMKLLSMVKIITLANQRDYSIGTDKPSCAWSTALVCQG